MHAMALEQPHAQLAPGSTVLDVGSGSGLLTTVMAEMVGETGRVVGIDHVPELVQWSKDNVRRAGKQELLDSGRLQLLVRDGFAGYAEGGPYDAIHVGAAPPTVPDELKRQLKPGGVLLTPVGPAGGSQEFVRITRAASEVEGGGPPSCAEERLFGVRYVPLTSLEEQMRAA